jgi:hypothetical protein
LCPYARVINHLHDAVMAGVAATDFLGMTVRKLGRRSVYQPSLFCAL